MDDGCINLFFIFIGLFLENILNILLVFNFVQFVIVSIDMFIFIIEYFLVISNIMIINIGGNVVFVIIKYRLIV